MDYPLLNVFWSTMWFFIWILWFMLLFRVIADIFRDDSLGGWAKAAWSIFVIVLPFLGVFVYLIARGDAMGAREREHSGGEPAGASTGHAGELAQLAELKKHGDLTAEEYERAKAKVLAA